MYHMVQKCSYLRVLEVFFVEPTTIHFIKEISKRIKLAPTSVRKLINNLSKEELIKTKKSKPFDGFIANRENENFIFYKRVYNLYSLKESMDFIVSKCYPKLIVVFGSYCLGEDIEKSDIDLYILPKTKKEINLEKCERKLKRKINIISTNIDKLEKNLKKKIYNGVVLHGSF